MQAPFSCTLASDHPCSHNQHHNQIISRIPSVSKNKHIVHNCDSQTRCCICTFLRLSVAGVYHSIVKMLFLRFFAFLAAGWRQLFERFYHIHLESLCVCATSALTSQQWVFKVRLGEFLNCLEGLLKGFKIVAVVLVSFVLRFYWARRHKRLNLWLVWKINHFDNAIGFEHLRAAM